MVMLLLVVTFYSCCFPEDGPRVRTWDDWMCATEFIMSWSFHLPAANGWWTDPVQCRPADTYLFMVRFPKQSPGSAPQLHLTGVHIICRIQLSTEKWGINRHLATVPWPVSLPYKSSKRTFVKISQSRRRPLIHERAFSWLKVPTSAFTFKALLT